MYQIFSGLRIDGRRPNELRKLTCKLGVLHQADGSAFLEQGNTKILASVYGPHDVSTSVLLDQVSCNIVMEVDYIPNTARY